MPACRLDFDLRLEGKTQLSDKLAEASPGGAPAAARAVYDLLADCIRAALCSLFVAPNGSAPSSDVACVFGGGAAAQACKLSLHLISAAIIPDNEHAGAAVRVRVLDELRRRAAGGGALACCLCAADATKAIDGINTRNRLRRLTGHSKRGEGRWSMPAPWSSHVPPSMLYVCPASSGGGAASAQTLAWRVAPMGRLLPSSPPRPASRPRASAAACRRGPEQMLSPRRYAVSSPTAAELRAIRDEAAAIHELSGARVVRVLPPSADWPSWCAYTDCLRCPLALAQQGAAHRSSVLFLRFTHDRVLLRCASARHKALCDSRPYAHPGSAATLFPPTAAAAAAAGAAAVAASPPAASTSGGRLKRKRESMTAAAALLSPQAIAAIFSPKWASAPPPLRAGSRFSISPATLARVFSPTWLRCPTATG
jgi:hypothetical protein